jgi:membrane-bound lytic murein transglycosylase A
MTGAPSRAGCRIAAGAAVLLGLAPGTHAAPAASTAPLIFPDAQIEMLDWSAVDGWMQDDLAAAFAAFRTSCKPLIARAKAELRRPTPRPADVRPMRRALADVCDRAAALDRPGSDAARRFFEAHFRPVQIAKLGEEKGFLTGYYEPILEGSRFPSDEYDVPVYAPPSNLIAAGRRHMSGGFPNKGKVGRRLGRRKIVPYYDRGEIEDGILAGRGLEICWLKDPVDALFMQIQGSARVKLDTGKTLRLNYAAHNGFPYTPVGRVLIDRGLVSRADMSMDRIRDYMTKNPVEGAEVRRQNRSYVFMRETGLADADEPAGAQGVALTPLRSIAVDSKLHVYGTPFFISAELPIDGEAPTSPFRRLMVAQDTGSAIVGPARADIYFGSGDKAGEIAGRLKQPGRFVMLVPRTIDPVLAGKRMPIPRPRPPERKVRVSSAASSIATADTASVATPAGAVPLPKPRPSRSAGGSR